MVQPLPSVTLSGRPTIVLSRPDQRQVTACKHNEFRAHLGKLSVHPESLPERARGLETDATRIEPPEKELSLGLESSPCLAPEDQPSFGRGGGEVAEWFSLFNPAGGGEAAVAAPAQAMPHAGVAEVADLVERWVRRVAIGGDQRRGAVRLDIGQGRFSGAELLVVAEAGHVSVELQLPANLVEGDLSERLRARLERRGYAADVVVR